MQPLSIVAIVFVIVIIALATTYYLVNRSTESKELKGSQKRYNGIHDKYKSLLDK